VTSANLDNLAKVGQLVAEPADEHELRALVESGRKRLKDARNPDNELESRFDLAYNAAHALALAALRAKGYRAKSRYIVFQALPYTAGMDDSEWRVLATCHDRRNKYEYEGELNIDEALLADALAVADKLLQALKGVPR
jgi:hypothetical protein